MVGQREPGAGSLAHSAFGPDRSAMRLDQPAGDEETEPTAANTAPVLVWNPIEVLEDLEKVFRRNPFALIDACTAAAGFSGVSTRGYPADYDT